MHAICIWYSTQYNYEKMDQILISLVSVQIMNNATYSKH